VSDRSSSRERAACGALPRARSRRARLAAARAVACGVVIHLVGAGCGDPDPEDALADAGSELASASEHRAAADAEVERVRGRLRDLEDELEDAQRVASEAAAHVVEAEKRLGELASDDVLFRVLQRRLLEDGELADSAVRVEVEQRIATLRGEVEREEARTRAGEIARGVPGVLDVVNEIALPKASQAD